MGKTRSRPNNQDPWSYDQGALSDHAGLVGVDEAGRGALAGPVVAAAVFLNTAFYEQSKRTRTTLGVRDSKQLSPEEREDIHARLQVWQTEGVIRCAWALATVDEIDCHNILGATRLAMHRCLVALAEEQGIALAKNDSWADSPLGASQSPRVGKVRVLVDGRPLRPFDWQHEGVVKGDDLSLAIGMASIIAKVERDRLMTTLAERYPHYGFETHRGYGTIRHRQALQAHGACPEHRPLFLRKVITSNASVLNP